VTRFLALALLFKAFALALLTGCEARVDDAVFAEQASSRPYLVSTKHGHDGSRSSPVLVVLHAYGTGSDVLVRAHALRRLAVVRRDWILVVPEGTPDLDGHVSWNASAACCGARKDAPDDVGYLHAVLEDLRRRIAVDPARVFAIGESNGGFMAHRWACSGTGDVRAIVSISGAAPGPDDPPCAAKVAVSVLEIHGDQDEVFRYQGGRSGRGRYPSTAESVAIWRRLDDCDPLPRSSRRWRPFPGSFRVEDWSCPSARVTLWTVEGAAHQIHNLRVLADEILDFLEHAPLGRG